MNPAELRESWAEFWKSRGGMVQAGGTTRTQPRKQGNSQGGESMKEMVGLVGGEWGSIGWK